MPVAIHIPTPLRPFTDKLDTVQASGATVGEVLQDLTTKYAGLKQHLYSADGKLRSFVNIYVGDEDIRYLQKEQTPVADGQTLSIIPSVAGGTGATAPAAALPALEPEEIKRYSRHLILSEVGHGGAAEAQGRQGAAASAPAGWARRWRLYLAAAGVGTHRHRRLRHRRPEQPAAPDPARHRRHRPLQAGLGHRHAAAHQPAREGRLPRGGAQLAERPRPLPRLRRGRRRHRQLPDALPGQRRLRAARHPERLRQHLPLRGSGVGLRHQGRPVLPLPVSRAAAAGPGAELRRGRRARHPARAGRHHPGDRGGEADPRHRRDAGRPVPASTTRCGCASAS